MNRSQKKSALSVQNIKKSIQIKGEPVKTGRSSQNDQRENPENYNAKQSKMNMQLMFQANKQYLMDKIAISQVPRPSKYYHKIPSKTPNTTYNYQYHKINPNLMNKLKLERKDNLYNAKNVVSNYQSLYSQNYSHINEQTKKLASTTKQQDLQTKERNKYTPTEGPTFLQTSYSMNFGGNYNSIPTQSAKMKEIQLMGGGKFQGQTTYHGVFKNHMQKRQRPIYQSNNKIFMTIDTPKETTYDKEFNSKTKAKTSKSRIVESAPQSSRRKRASSQMVSTEQLDKKKYQSEYEMSFQSMQPGTPLKGNKTSIMSLQDMKNMILNVI